MAERPRLSSSAGRPRHHRADVADVSKVLSIIGLALTVLGALVLAYRDLRPRRQTWDSAAVGFPRREAWIGFPLIALGSGLQIVGVVLS